MDRFFSKLDLRDIKIDPFRTSFPPDAEETPRDEESVAEYAPAPVDVDAPAPIRDERQPHAPAWATEPAAAIPSAQADETYYGAGYAETTEPAVVVADNGFDDNGDVLKVSARSRPSAVAGAIAGVVRENGRAEVQAIGAGATNQAVKAVAIARDYLRETGIEAICLPAFIDVTIENEERTAMRLIVEPR